MSATAQNTQPTADNQALVQWIRLSAQPLESAGDLDPLLAAIGDPFNTPL